MARKKKAELVEEAEALGVDAEGLNVPELEVAVTAAEQAVVATASATADAPRGRHAAHAVGTSQGVHIQLGHIVDDGSGTMVFQFASEFVLGREESLVLAEEIGFAVGDHHRALTHTG